MNQVNNKFIGFEQDVIETGFVDNSRVSLYINASNVCVLPLKNMAKNNTRPLKLLEYFACGKIVLSLPNEELEREFGEALTIFHNAEELANILKSIAKGNIDAFLTKISRGYKYAQENSWDNHAKSYERLLQSLSREE